MIIQLNTADFQSTDAIQEHVEKEITHALQHFADRVTRVEVHLHDENARKSGPTDKRCTMEARLAGKQPLAVEHATDDMYNAVTETAAKLARAIKRIVEKDRPNH